MTSEKAAMTEAEKQGHRRAHQAALYANLRTVLFKCLREKNPVLGVHGFWITEDLDTGWISAGSTPELPYMLSVTGAMQGDQIARAMARQVGDFKKAGVGDTFNAELGATQCIGCEDGDPTGAHAKSELEENARAWLGLTILVAEMFYGPHLPDEVRELLKKLGEHALPADASVS